MERLLHFLSSNSSLTQDDLCHCFQAPFKFSSWEKQDLVQLVNEAFINAHDKLKKYLIDGAQPANKFLDEVRILDPRNLVQLHHDLESVDNIPGIEDVLKSEWELYVNVLGPAAVKHTKEHQRFFHIHIFYLHINT